MTTTDFLPEYQLASTEILVTPSGQPDAKLKPIEYYINGLIRHREKLTGMAGDRYRNAPLACIQNGMDEGRRTQDTAHTTDDL